MGDGMVALWLHGIDAPVSTGTKLNSVLACSVINNYFIKLYRMLYRFEGY